MHRNWSRASREWRSIFAPIICDRCHPNWSTFWPLHNFLILLWSVGIISWGHPLTNGSPNIVWHFLDMFPFYLRSWFFTSLIDSFYTCTSFGTPAPPPICTHACAHTHTFLSYHSFFYSYSFLTLFLFSLSFPPFLLSSLSSDTTHMVTATLPTTSAQGELQVYGHNM